MEKGINQEAMKPGRVFNDDSDRFPFPGFLDSRFIDQQSTNSYQLTYGS